MNEPDPSIEYYNQNAEAFYRDTVDLDLSYLTHMFTERLWPGAHILDAGCGSGRDSLAFLRLGFQVTAMDASAELARRAEALLGQPVLLRRFQELDFEEAFDGIWANASLLHVPRAEIDAVLERLIRALKPGGILYMSFKDGPGEVVRHGRLFNDYELDEFEALVAAHPRLELVKIWTSEDTRPGKVLGWVNGLLRRRF